MALKGGPTMGDLDRSGVGLLGSLYMNNREVSAVRERAPNFSLHLKAIKRVVGRTCWKMDSPTAPQSAVSEEPAANASPRPLERHCHSEGDLDTSPDHKRVVTVGICAMNKKTSAPPMQNILSRLRQQDYILIIIFTDHTILELSVEEWPICDCFIAFYSKGFPLEKAIDYVKLRDPMVVSDLQMQYSLMDRRKVYEILAKHGVEVPKYAILNREEDKEELIETDDTIEIRGQVFHKPFVEKPVSAEDHKIHIYFPSDYGGGCQKLFRKVHDRSSEYSKQSSVRKIGSYIYEDFMPTDGTDVKVYTVGPDYAHAEARKSPALDGKVERDEQGKEVRYPVILTAKEKLIARKVCQAFKQTVCGFDMLRANGKSYVCDVNGFSFVKNSQKYYEDCAQILLEMITAQLAPEHFPQVPPSVEYLAEEVPVPIPRTGNLLELRCVVGVIRHGDRTPKQKMKMIVKHKKFIELFAELGGYKNGQLKIKKPKLLQRVLDIARYLLENVEKYHASHEIEEKVHKLQQLRTVLEMYGHFSGINRKVQFKLLSKKGENGAPLLLLILKWGGELTPMGQKQAEELGRAFRCMYPGGEGEYASLPGSGFLRLHSTYRHDLKVYASDEGRVQMTAAAFTKGLLDLEGNVASVLVHLVKRDQNATNMLDTSTTAHDNMCTVKEHLHELLRSPYDLDEARCEELAPTKEDSLISALRHIRTPKLACEQLYQKICLLMKEIKAIIASGKQFELYQGETLQTMLRRWAKLEKDFKSKEGRFDISKVPDIYDCIKYDLLHNRHLNLKNGTELYCLAMHLADVVIPQEYGITKDEKLEIATRICTPLLRKIQADLHHTIMDEFSDINHRLDPRLSKGVISPNRHVRTRLYFTSESHVHTLLNILRYGGLVEDPSDPVWKKVMEKVGSIPELNYMTQIVFMLFENITEPLDSKLRYRVDVQFSPGVKGREDVLKGTIREHSADSSPECGHGKPGMWVKRLPVTFDALAEGLSLEDDHHNMLTMSPSSILRHRKMSAPDASLRSASESQLLKKAVPISIQHVQTLADSLLDHSNYNLHSLSASAIENRSGIVDDRAKRRSSAEDMHLKKSPPNSSSDFTGLLSDSPPSAEHRILFVPSVATLSEHSLVEGGLELAAELASTVEPLLCLHSMPLELMNTYLTKHTGITLDYDRPKPTPKHYSVHSRVPSRTPSTSRTPSNTPTCTPTPSHTPTPTPTPTPTRSPTPTLPDLKKVKQNSLSSAFSEQTPP